MSLRGNKEFLNRQEIIKHYEDYFGNDAGGILTKTILGNIVDIANASYQKGYEAGKKSGDVID